MRPSRFDQLLNVPLPDLEARVGVLKAKLHKSPVAPDVNLLDIATASPGLSCSDLTSIYSRAVKLATRESIKKETDMKELGQKITEDPVPFITRQHFEEGVLRAQRSVSDANICTIRALSRR